MHLGGDVEILETNALQKWALGTVPELLFEKKNVIPALQQLLVSH